MSESPADDAAMARIARSLADALMSFAHSRSDDDKKAISALHTELCALRRAEAAPKEGVEA